MIRWFFLSLVQHISAFMDLTQLNKKSTSKVIFIRYLTQKNLLPNSFEKNQAPKIVILKSAFRIFRPTQI